jgi:hypothetical protein
MSTDTIIHLHLMLDRLRETQARHGEMLFRQGEMIAELIRMQRSALRRSTPSTEASASTPLNKWTLFLKPVATSAGQWAGGVLAMAYVMKGGDLLTAFQTLLKLF